MSNWGEDDLSNHQLEVDGYGRNMIQTQQVTNFYQLYQIDHILIDFITYLFLDLVDFITNSISSLI